MISFLIALLVTAWFALLARQTGRNPVCWGVGGFFFALVLTTMIEGVAEAAFIPYSSADHVRFRLKTIVLAIVLNAALGLLFTATLVKEYLARRTNSAAAPPAPSRR